MQTSWIILGVFAYLLAQATTNAQAVIISEETGCPLNVQHVCTYCAQDFNRFGCYCEIEDGELITANLMTPCPSDIADPCANHACQNGATCVQDGLAQYKCSCPPGFGGDRCNETLPKCNDSNIICRNAECIDTSDPKMPVYCQCYDGTRRDPRRNESCPLSPCYKEDTDEPVCRNNGTCRIVNNAYICECRGGFGGQNCTRPLQRPLCADVPNVCGEGTCQQSITIPYYSCNCGNHPSTFASRNISDLVKCEESGCYAVNPCQNGGTCVNRGKGAFLCQCSSRFTGSRCEKRSACYENPCLNRGVCEAYNETVYFCTCPPYFTGRRCEVAVPDPCASKNCGPYGQCRDNAGIGVCMCSDGLHHDGSPCQNPCLNVTCGPGTCSPKANTTYQWVCTCPVSRTGDQCQISKDICRTMPPCGGGYCKPNYQVPRGYSCICEGGVVKNEPCPFSKTCPIKDCGTQGICVESDGIVLAPNTKPIYYVCSCKKGYISAGNCDDVLEAKLDDAKTICGPNGNPYPSRNPYSPIGCWCNNGTHIEQIEENGPRSYCP